MGDEGPLDPDRPHGFGWRGSGAAWNKYEQQHPDAYIPAGAQRDIFAYKTRNAVAQVHQNFEVKVSFGNAMLPPDSTSAQVRQFVNEVNAGISSGLKSAGRIWTHPLLPPSETMLDTALGINHH